MHLEEKTDFIVALADRKKAREERVGGVVELDWLTKKGAKYRLGSILKILEGAISNDLITIVDGTYLVNEKALNKLKSDDVIEDKPKPITKEDIVEKQIDKFSKKIEEDDSGALDLRIKDKKKVADEEIKIKPVINQNNGIKISSITPAKNETKKDDLNEQLKSKVDKDMGIISKPTESIQNEVKERKNDMKSDIEILSKDSAFSISPLAVPKEIKPEESLPVTYKVFNEHLDNFSSEIKTMLDSFKKSIMDKIESIQKQKMDDVGISALKLGLTQAETDIIELKKLTRYFENKIDTIETDYKAKTEGLGKIAEALKKALESKLKHL